MYVGRRIGLFVMVRDDRLGCFCLSTQRFRFSLENGNDLNRNKIRNRSFTENFLRIVLCLCCWRFLYKITKDMGYSPLLHVKFLPDFILCSVRFER